MKTGYTGLTPPAAPAKKPSPFAKGASTKMGAAPQAATTGNPMPTTAAATIGAATGSTATPAMNYAQGGTPGMPMASAEGPGASTGPTMAEATGTTDIAAQIDQGQAGEAGTPDQGKEPSESDKFYDDLLAQKDASWGNIEAMQQANNAAMQRRVQAMQGAAGRSVAGGWMGNVMQAFLGGQQNLMQARGQFDQEKSALAMDIMSRKQSQSNWDTSRQDQIDQFDTGMAADAAGAQRDAGYNQSEIDMLNDDDPSNDQYAEQSLQQRKNRDAAAAKAAGIREELAMLDGDDSDEAEERRKALEQQLTATGA